MQRNDFASIWPLPWTALSSALPTPTDNENTIPHKMVEKQFARLSALGTLLWPIMPLRFSSPARVLPHLRRSAQNLNGVPLREHSIHPCPLWVISGHCRDPVGMSLCA